MEQNSNLFFRDFFLADENKTLSFAASLSANICPGMLIFLQGITGSGKTTFVRGILYALGCNKKVTSPSYTLIEEYHIKNLHILHMDLYRCESLMDIESTGIRDYMDSDTVIIVEWPEKFTEFFSNPSVKLEFNLKESGRNVHVSSKSANIITNLEEKYLCFG